MSARNTSTSGPICPCGRRDYRHLNFLYQLSSCYCPMTRFQSRCQRIYPLQNRRVGTYLPRLRTPLRRRYLSMHHHRWSHCHQIDWLTLKNAWRSPHSSLRVIFQSTPLALTQHSHTYSNLAFASQWWKLKETLMFQARIRPCQDSVVVFPTPPWERWVFGLPLYRFNSPAKGWIMPDPTGGFRVY